MLNPCIWTLSHGNHKIQREKQWKMINTGFIQWEYNIMLSSLSLISRSTVFHFIRMLFSCSHRIDLSTFHVSHAQANTITHCIYFFDRKTFYDSVSLIYFLWLVLARANICFFFFSLEKRENRYIISSKSTKLTLYSKAKNVRFFSGVHSLCNGISK